MTSDDPTKGSKQGEAEGDVPLGPRGGKTTVSKDGYLVRKTFFIDRDAEQHLRDEAHSTRRTEAEIVREIIRDRYGLE